MNDKEVVIRLRVIEKDLMQIGDTLLLCKHFTEDDSTRFIIGKLLDQTGQLSSSLKTALTALGE